MLISLCLLLRVALDVPAAQEVAQGRGVVELDGLQVVLGLTRSRLLLDVVLALVAALALAFTQRCTVPLPSPNPVNSVKGQFLTAGSQNNLLEHSHHPVNTIVLLSGLEFIPEMAQQ